jgi:hypothetical protein
MRMLISYAVLVAIVGVLVAIVVTVRRVAGISMRVKSTIGVTTTTVCVYILSAGRRYNGIIVICSTIIIIPLAVYVNVIRVTTKIILTITIYSPFCWIRRLVAWRIIVIYGITNIGITILRMHSMLCFSTSYCAWRIMCNMLYFATNLSIVTRSIMLMHRQFTIQFYLTFAPVCMVASLNRAAVGSMRMRSNTAGTCPLVASCFENKIVLVSRIINI